MLMRPSEELPNSFESNESFRTIKMRMDADYNQNISIFNILWEQNMLNARLEAGDTALASEMSQGPLSLNSSNNYYFNYVRPLCNMVSGYQRKNRKSIISVPLENGDQDTADQFSKILINLIRKSGGDETISRAFHKGSCISSISLIHVYLDYSEDPLNGDIQMQDIDFSHVFLDPYSKKPDLSDAKFVWIRSYVTNEQAAQLVPDKRDFIMSLTSSPTGMGRDGRFQFAEQTWGQSMQSLLSYDEYYYKDFRDQTLLIDKETGETLDVTGQDKDYIDSFVAENPQLTIIERQIPTINLSIAVNDHVVYNGRNPMNLDVYPFILVYGFFNSSLPYFYTRYQSLCTSLRDPQLLLNRRIMLSSDLLESTLNSGYIAMSNSLVDPKSLFQTGSGRVIFVKEGYNLTDIQPIQPPQIPPSFFDMQNTYKSALNDVSGINEELMGMSDQNGELPGITQMLRQGAALVTLQPLFDQLDNSIIQLGNLLMKVVQNNFTPGKIRLILEGQEPAPLFYNKAFGKYHCQVEQGFNTETQKQMQFAQLLQLIQLNVPIPPQALLEASTLQNKSQIIQMIEQQNQQQAQTQQAQFQAQMEQQQAQSALAYSTALANQGLYNERTSRMEENRAMAVQKLADANKQNEAAALEKAKLMKELSTMDMEEIYRMLEVAQQLKTYEKMEQTQDKQMGYMGNMNDKMSGMQYLQTQGFNKQPNFGGQNG